MALVRIGNLWVNPDEVVLVGPGSSDALRPSTGCQIYFRSRETGANITDMDADTFVRKLTEGAAKATASQHRVPLAQEAGNG